MKKYGVMVIGCGHIGCEHLSDIYFRNDIRICAVIDTDEKAAVTAARKFGAEKYGTDYRDFLSSPDIDIVIAATYVHSHYEIVKACIEHGKHVLCEKPVATTADEGKKFFDLARNASVKVQVAYILRHNKTYQKAAELIQNGAIGELRAIRMAHNHNADNWHRFYNLLSDCMPVVDCGVHYFDVASWFTGSDITEISGMGALLDDDAPKLNYNIVNFKTASGCSCVYEAAWGRNVASRNLKEFILLGALKCKLCWKDAMVLFKEYNNKINQSIAPSDYAPEKTLAVYKNYIENIHTVDDLKYLLETNQLRGFFTLTRNTHYLALFDDIDWTISCDIPGLIEQLKDEVIDYYSIAAYYKNMFGLHSIRMFLRNISHFLSLTPNHL